MSKDGTAPDVLAFGKHPLPPDFPVFYWVRLQYDDGGPARARYLGSHNGLEIGYCHHGEGVFAVGGRLFHFGPGFVSVVPPMSPHHTWSRKGTRCEWSFALTDPDRLLFGGPVKDLALFDTTRFAGPRFPNLLPPAEHPHIVSLITRILDENQEKRPYHEQAVRACFLGLLVELNRLAGPARRRLAPVPCPVDQVERLRPALQLIQTRYTQKLSVAGMAERCHMSKSNFRQVFKQVMGKGPYQYLTEARIARACLELKENKKKIEAIAWDNGFPSPSCFVRQFRDIMHMAPRRWARLHGA
ncbi:MAG: helix-turn-helix transcriptional regulator [Kiritimatiellae bacterium]|nr:helix-turn-helix transcriptional regulator [Kiritimatiellia bacterium]